MISLIFAEYINRIFWHTTRSEVSPDDIPDWAIKLTAIGAVLAVTLFGYYKWSNYRRNQQRPAARDDLGPLVEDQCDVTDRKNAAFRYVY